MTCNDHDHEPVLSHTLKTLNSCTCQSTNARDRFVLSSTKEVDDELATETRDLRKEMENLNGRLHYLETTQKNAKDHMEQIFKNSGN